MRRVVDLNRCQGYAQCAFLAPDVFTMRGEESLLCNPRAEEARRDEVARAVAACPVQAILLEGADGVDGTPGSDQEATGER
ncbi:ferredoxin [Streptomyces sp. NPDC002928]|uniref:ferredoxin n=1 Tax=Streptomyces sp. NPDC002928 TaxID=3154440 RepID=UPI0033A81BA7